MKAPEHCHGNRNGLLHCYSSMKIRRKSAAFLALLLCPKLCPNIQNNPSQNRMEPHRRVR
jgi:hypothetical protein